MTCPRCKCEHLYRRKDFNRKFGITLIAVGVVLSYWTYGVSLVVVTLLDWLLSITVGEVGICYQCEEQFRDKEMVKQLPPFNLSLHDYYMNLKIASGFSDPRNDKGN